MTDPALTPIYPPSGEGATSLLGGHLRSRISRDGPLSFADFMAEALYHPEWGYYSAPNRTRVGREGDFITSVSVGSTFGSLLAARLHSFWLANGSPPEFHLLEPGPESGDLALDILKAATPLDPPFRAALRYHALEPIAAKRQCLESRFAELDEPHLQVHQSASDLRFPFGAVLANEIVDALPVHLIEWQNNDWSERLVTCDKDAFRWTTQPITNPDLRDALPDFPSPPENGYVTEVCLAYQSFLTPLATALDSGLYIFIDYGHAEADYYAPSRATGTLQTFHQHQATDNPLHHPGSQDLTAHANFTRLAEIGRQLGLAPTGFTRQERYLTALAEPLLSSFDPTSPEFASIVRQFRTLTHPSMLGGAFHMLEFTKGETTWCPKPFQFDQQGLEML
jgi:SAM-dependent MidA family methyltransferase